MLQLLIHWGGLVFVALMVAWAIRLRGVESSLEVPERGVPIPGEPAVDPEPRATFPEVDSPPGEVKCPGEVEKTVEVNEPRVAPVAASKSRKFWRDPLPGGPRVIGSPLLPPASRGRGGTPTQTAGASADVDATRWASLTARERETATLSVLKQKEIAERMGISVEGVKKHSQNARAKLGVRDKVALALYAARMGALEPSSDGGGADEVP